MAIWRTTLAKGSLRSSRSVVFWYLRISFRALTPGLDLLTAGWFLLGWFLPLPTAGRLSDPAELLGDLGDLPLDERPDVEGWLGVEGRLGSDLPWVYRLLWSSESLSLSELLGGEGRRLATLLVAPLAFGVPFLF